MNLILNSFRVRRYPGVSRRGMIIVELMVALSVLMVGLIAILTLLNRSLALTRAITENYAATYLAAEGVEVVKNLVDGNHLQGKIWGDGFGGGGTFEVVYDSATLSSDLGRFLSFDPTTHLYGYAGGDITPFKRRVEVSFFDNDGDGVGEEMKVNSVVLWQGPGGLLQINLEDHFYKWRL